MRGQSSVCRTYAAKALALGAKLPTTTLSVAFIFLLVFTENSAQTRSLRPSTALSNPKRPHKFSKCCFYIIALQNDHFNTTKIFLILKAKFFIFSFHDCMINIPNLRCTKDFHPFRILNISKKGQPSDLYKIVKGKKQKVGEFRLTNKGFVNSLVIKNKYRRTKTGAFALLSVLDFIKTFADKKNLDFLYFCGSKSNPNNVVRLYSKTTTQQINTLTDRVYFILPSSLKKQEALKTFNEFVKISDDDVQNIIPIAK